VCREAESTLPVCIAAQHTASERERASEEPPSMKKKHKNPQREIQKKYSSRLRLYSEKPPFKRTRAELNAARLLVK
jgi:hypothetical protein